jgi:hypothetical protein
VFFAWFYIDYSRRIMEEASVKNLIKENNSVLLSQMKVFLKESCGDLKRSNQEVADQHLEQIKKLKRETNPTFKKKSNEDQYKTNKAFLESFEDVKSSLEAGQSAKAAEHIEQGMSLIKERQKLILMADKSPYGWKTVLEYKHNDLAEDDEDEKKMFRAETMAGTKAKKFFNNRSQSRRPYVSQQPQMQPSFSSGNANARSNFQNNPPRNSGACFACGKFGHWRACCPNTNASTTFSESK